MIDSSPPGPASVAVQTCQASRLCYLEAGAGDPATVLLHGWGDTKEIWRPALTALVSRGGRALAPDLPGHGESPLAGAARMAHLAERVATLAAARGLRTFDLVGHSMGGNVALELALARPELVRRLVLVAPAALGPEMPAYTRIYLHPAAGWAALRASLALYAGVAALAARLPEEWLRRAALPGLRRSASARASDPAGLRALLQGLFDNPLGPRLAGVHAPTLVVSGELDPLVPAALSRRVAAAIPGARYAGITRAAHHPMDERPHEFLQLLLDFLAS
jgi:pimeloyl-ACP methyl ester carboxylesterase